MEIIPGILEKDWESIEKKIELVRPFARWVHIDLLDGKFASNTTLLDPKPFAKYSQDIFFELHMMVENPIEYLQPFADVGFRRFIGHVEKMSSQVDFVAKGQLVGEVGLALDAGSPVDAISVPLDDLDCLLVMTIKAGFSGQAFMPEMLSKVKRLKEKTQIPIEVDGGVNNTTIQEGHSAGATRFVTTSYLYGSYDIQKAYKTLRECIEKPL